MWSNVIGQERAKEILSSIFNSGRISHAYIFYGNEGIGKDAAAIEFAKVLNCDNRQADNQACDVCKSCIDIGSFKSPLFKFITALPSGKNETDEDINPLEKLDKEDFANYLSEIELKSRDKYHKFFLAKANDIRIISIRQIKNDIYLTGRSGKKKVFLISCAEKLNPQSSNSLLKILEEPPKDSVIILTTSRINSIIPTIVGRCQKVKFDNLTKSNIADYISKKDDRISKPDAEFFSGIAEGSITKCNEILENNFLELREKVLDLLTAILTNQQLKLGNEIDYVIGKKDKQRIKQFLILMNIWFADINFKMSGNEHLIINRDKIDRINKFVASFSSQNYKIINSIEEAIKDLDGNIFPDLLLYNLSFKIKSYIKKKD